MITVKQTNNCICLLVWNYKIITDNASNKSSAVDFSVSIPLVNLFLKLSQHLYSYNSGRALQSWSTKFISESCMVWSQYRRPVAPAAAATASQRCRQWQRHITVNEACHQVPLSIIDHSNCTPSGNTIPPALPGNLSLQLPPCINCTRPQHGYIFAFIIY